MKQILVWESSGSSRIVQWAGYISQHVEQKVYLSISGLFQKKTSMVADKINAFLNTPLKLGLS